VRGTAVFVALVIGQLGVILTFALTSIGFLWYNVIGCGALVIVSLLVQALTPGSRLPPATVLPPR
jgi:hypothetical protein